MCLFYDRLEESKKGFDYFPKEWEELANGSEYFIDFAMNYSKGGNRKIISIKRYLVPDSFSGFVKIGEEECEKAKIKKGFYHIKEGKIDYLQQEFFLKNCLIKQTSFITEPFLIRRVYMGFEGNFGGKNFPLVSVTRVGSFPKEKELSIRVFQNSKNRFNISFLKEYKELFNFNIDSKKYPFHKDLVSIIHSSPLVFSDFEILKTYFKGKKFEIKEGKKSFLTEFDKFIHK